MRKRNPGQVCCIVMMVVTLVLVAAPATAVAQEYSTKNLNEQLVMATLWYQASAEMRAISYQSFNLAKMILDQDLAKAGSSLKRAVVVDIDETVLDNSPYEAGIIGNDFGYPKGWKEWIDEASAEALPGSIEFLNYAVAKGVDVFYISNRKVRGQDATIQNLRALGFPQANDAHVLLREKTSDKEPRRQIVRKNHRIVLLMGDNLNDFDSIFRKKGTSDRAAAVDAMKDKFGARFIVLPNPMYGDWEGAAYNFNWKLSPPEKSDARKSKLNRWAME